MKNLLLGTLLGILLALVPIAYTQQQGERIFVGTTSLQLGMEKDAVISRLAEQGYRLSRVEGPPSQGDQWLVSEKNAQAEYDLLGSIVFMKGRLSTATRYWAESWDSGSAKIARNLYFLAKSLEDSGNTTCVIETNPSESPEFDQKDIRIHCGRRTLGIDVSKYKEQREVTQLWEGVK